MSAGRQYRIAQATARLTRVAADLRTETCTLQRYTASSDGMGGQTETWSALAANVSCYRQISSSAEREVAGVAQDVVSTTFRFAAGTTLAVRDRIVATDATYEVTGILSPQTLAADLAVTASLIR